MTTAKNIRLHILEEITNGFSVDSRIGRGGYGDVYKGVYKGEVIAVKLLHDDPEQVLDDRQFHSEVVNLLRVEHPNIVRLRGYCYEAQYKYVEHEGKDRLCKHMYKVLCFEYMQGGSLDKHLQAQSFAPNWSTCYNIIKGICEGLNFLHGCKPPIFHLDLKPANILLDSSMAPKVADFGLSRLFGRSCTHVTEKIIGTQKYMPPEFIKYGIISPKNDVFSLGVIIIEIMTQSMCTHYSEMGDVKQFIHEVHTNWKNMIEATSEYPSAELHQVQTCIDTAMHCVDPDRNSRPTMADVMDILNKTGIHIPKRQLTDVLPCPTLSPNNTMAKRLKTVTTEVDNIKNENQNFNCMPKDIFNINGQQVLDRETSSDVEQTLIIGRTEEKQKILSILSASIAEEMVILPIHGIGGIGKTTLAQLVFNDTQFHEYSRAWVYVSQKLDLKKIGNSLISQLSKDTSHVADMQIIHSRLVELLAGKRILIVLDDLWEEDPYKLDKLKAMLRLGRGRKVIVVTTRDEAIASKICSTVMPYKLESLTDDMCWTIIKQKSDFKSRVDKKQLKQIGKDIAEKCGGMALAAQSLGYMLSDMTSDQWESVRDSYIWNLSNSEHPSLRNHEVLASLHLSYSHMHERLQSCFLYCAVFSKGRNIVKSDLIHQWIALGFIGPSRILDSMQLCEKYVTQLLGMSFLENSMAFSSDGFFFEKSDRWRDRTETLFVMHDLVHDLARALLADKVNEKGNAVGSNCQYALLTDCSKPLQLSMTSPENIKTLLFLDCGKIELHGCAFSSAKCLLVLDLSECFIQKLPDCIGQLKQLRFLNAPRIQHQMIPNCMTELSELNYLNLSGSHNIPALPESIGDMKALMHLDLSGCVKIHELPVSFAELKQLVHLDLSHCSISEAEALGGLTKLQYLNLSGNKGHIRRLSKVTSNLIKLRYLNISGCKNTMVPESENEIARLDCVCTLFNLEHLDLSKNESYFCIPESIGNLMKLHTLDLLGCSRLKLPADLVVHASSDKFSSNISLLCLQVLTIYRLENVKSAEEARCIKLMQIQKIIELRFEWTVVPGRSVDDKEVLEKLLPPSSVQRLYISGYSSFSIPDWLMCIRQHLPNLSQLYLSDFPNCNNLPSLGQLSYLRELGFCRMESLEEWNTAYTRGKPVLDALTIDQCAKLMIKPCAPRATVLRIIDSDNVLSSWEESSSHRGASSSPITKLFVKNSKVPLHQWRLLHQLPALRSLTITGCSDLTTSPKIIQQLSSLVSLSFDQAELPRWLAELTSLQDLRLSECRGMTSLPQWLGKLTFLKKLQVTCCKGIGSLPDSIQQLTKLEHLIIRDCPTLVKWCESEENKMKLVHIRGIVPRSLMTQEEDTPKIIGAAPIHGTIVMDEVDPDVLYSAVMNMPGFAEESLLVALSQLMDNTAQGSAYMAMSEEDRVSWLINFLKKY
ncbi:putative disease resistance protein RGA3 [Triticum dicoccoides]|uniref:putative disease resistance protein RGA3 n=1 Tax=Triticum dicoccoides TaxID=85692 RepID=UPI000E7912A0|nr:putative disease resistance protein RGA3 [Triticum dicoccoides]XP_037438963.1 putative disease resistance protein RGA3 [Triticum dicoccoides]